MEITIDGEDYLVLDGEFVSEEGFKKYFSMRLIRIID